MYFPSLLINIQLHISYRVISARVWYSVNRASKNQEFRASETTTVIKQLAQSGLNQKLALTIRLRKEKTSYN